MTKEEAHEWADLYAAIADGKKWQITTAPRVWRDACEDLWPPAYQLDEIRIKPEPQKVYVATWFDRDGMGKFLPNHRAMRRRLRTGQVIVPASASTLLRGNCHE
jgi:hypothetical protein